MSQRQGTFTSLEEWELHASDAKLDPDTFC